MKKVEKDCERCFQYLGFVYHTVKYCFLCRKIIKYQYAIKYRKEMYSSQQGGDHGRWGPSAK